GAAMRRRIPQRPGRRQPPEDGLHERRVARRRIHRLGPARAAGGEGMSPAAASRRAKAGPAQRPKPARAVSARKPATAAKDDFAAVFATLEQILAPYESRALTRAGGRTGFWLNSGKVGPNKYQYAFAGVR